MTPTWTVRLPASAALGLLDLAEGMGLAVTALPVDSDGTRAVTFGTRTHAVLSAAGRHYDGVISDRAMWVGGTAYPLTTDEEPTP